MKWIPLPGASKYEVNAKGVVRRSQPGHHTKPGRIVARCEGGRAPHVFIPGDDGHKKRHYVDTLCRMFLHPEKKEESWCEIPGLDGYAVSTWGRVMKTAGKVVTQFVSGDSEMCISLFTRLRGEERFTVADIIAAAETGVALTRKEPMPRGRERGDAKRKKRPRELSDEQVYEIDECIKKEGWKRDDVLVKYGRQAIDAYTRRGWYSGVPILTENGMMCGDDVKRELSEEAIKRILGTVREFPDVKDSELNEEYGPQAWMVRAKVGPYADTKKRTNKVVLKNGKVIRKEQ